MNKTDKIYIAGHLGLVGSAIHKNLKAKGYTNFVFRTLDEMDLRDTVAVANFFQEEKPAYVFLAAAKVGGIVANNTYRGEFIYDNLMIQNNIVHQSYVHGVQKLLFLGSTCIYPKNAPQPMPEDCLLTDTLEYTNEPYAIAKIAGIKLCESYNIQYGTNFISVMPTNLYGPNDNFDLEKSHVLPALIRKMHLGKALESGDWDRLRADLNTLPIEGIDGSATEAVILEKLAKYGITRKANHNRHPELVSGSHQENSNDSESARLNPQVQVEIWGTGKPMREFLWSEDMADACVFIMENRDFKDTICHPELVEGSHQESTRHSELVEESESRTNVIASDAKQSAAEKARHPELVSGSHQVKSNAQSTEIRNTHINIGTGKEISIRELAETIKNKVGFKGNLYFNTDKPDGTMKKLTNPSKLHGLGWKHTIELDEGIEKMYHWYLKNNNS
ncbi:GDP-L-fucose synthase [Lutibacter sp. TH_r2]|uniref:GDP-L-fucose synthase family protein n=1 Tax=Lutibacter sp. TH_r2 TaxID=3082083 RepID=UPI0029536D68|nr:GDP-L-fucose synthase [Lutibacter sp. TH_r2]MDV7187802.1 GDP-L-fucose synthase [Lutibacter sp. TH_r2]